MLLFLQWNLQLKLSVYLILRIFNTPRRSKDSLQSCLSDPLCEKGCVCGLLVVCLFCLFVVCLFCLFCLYSRLPPHSCYQTHTLTYTFHFVVFLIPLVSLSSFVPPSFPFFSFFEFLRSKECPTTTTTTTTGCLHLWPSSAFLFFFFALFLTPVLILMVFGATTSVA